MPQDRFKIFVIENNAKFAGVIQSLFDDANEEDWEDFGFHPNFFRCLKHSFRQIFPSKAFSERLQTLKGKNPDLLLFSLEKNPDEGMGVIAEILNEFENADLAVICREQQKSLIEKKFIQHSKRLHFLLRPFGRKDFFIAVAESGNLLDYLKSSSQSPPSGEPSTKEIKRNWLMEIEQVYAKYYADLLSVIGPSSTNREKTEVWIGYFKKIMLLSEKTCQLGRNRNSSRIFQVKAGNLKDLIHFFLLPWVASVKKKNEKMQGIFLKSIGLFHNPSKIRKFIKYYTDIDIKRGPTEDPFEAFDFENNAIKDLIFCKKSYDLVLQLQKLILNDQSNKHVYEYGKEESARIVSETKRAFEFFFEICFGKNFHKNLNFLDEKLISAQALEKRKKMNKRLFSETFLLSSYWKYRLSIYFKNDFSATHQEAGKKFSFSLIKYFQIRRKIQRDFILRLDFDQKASIYKHLIYEGENLLELIQKNPVKESQYLAETDLDKFNGIVSGITAGLDSNLRPAVENFPERPFSKMEGEDSEDDGIGTGEGESDNEAWQVSEGSQTDRESLRDEETVFSENDEHSQNQKNLTDDLESSFQETESEKKESHQKEPMESEPDQDLFLTANVKNKPSTNNEKSELIYDLIQKIYKTFNNLTKYSEDFAALARLAIDKNQLIGNELEHQRRNFKAIENFVKPQNIRKKMLILVPQEHFSLKFAKQAGQILKSNRFLNFSICRIGQFSSQEAMDSGIIVLVETLPPTLDKNNQPVFWKGFEDKAVIIDFDKGHLDLSVHNRRSIESLNPSQTENLELFENLSKLESELFNMEFLKDVLVKKLQSPSLGDSVERIFNYIIFQILVSVHESSLGQVDTFAKLTSNKILVVAPFAFHLIKYMAKKGFPQNSLYPLHPLTIPDDYEHFSDLCGYEIENFGKPDYLVYIHRGEKDMLLWTYIVKIRSGNESGEDENENGYQVILSSNLFDLVRNNSVFSTLLGNLLMYFNLKINMQPPEIRHMIDFQKQAMDSYGILGCFSELLEKIKQVKAEAQERTEEPDREEYAQYKATFLLNQLIGLLNKVPK